LTGSRKSITPEFQRVDLRPVEIKGEIFIQSISHDGKKDFTKNLALESDELSNLLNSGFANLIVDSTSESFQIQITKRGEAIVGTSRTRLERNLSHDHLKERALAESDPIFRALEMADSSGRIKPSERDKYIQIDQLLRLVEHLFADKESGSQIRVIDLASGSARLTFAVHAYLAKKFRVATLGIDRDEKLIEKASRIASKNEISGIRFQSAEIKSAPVEKCDLMLALHACDTATDDAIEYLRKSASASALIVPCCHQSRPEEVALSIKSMPTLAKDGILTERFADLVTDALRAERLRSDGYQVDVIEFVPDEHSGRNLLIRAVKPGSL
jgi:SAM-dependent methyltransferase